MHECIYMGIMYIYIRIDMYLHVFICTCIYAYVYVSMKSTFPKRLKRCCNTNAKFEDHVLGGKSSS